MSCHVAVWLCLCCGCLAPHPALWPRPQTWPTYLQLQHGVRAVHQGRLKALAANVRDALQQSRWGRWVVQQGACKDKERGRGRENSPGRESGNQRERGRRGVTEGPLLAGLAARTLGLKVQAGRMRTAIIPPPPSLGWPAADRYCPVTHRLSQLVLHAHRPQQQHLLGRGVKAHRQQVRRGRVRGRHDLGARRRVCACSPNHKGRAGRGLTGAEGAGGA